MMEPFSDGINESPNASCYTRPHHTCECSMSSQEIVYAVPYLSPALARPEAFLKAAEKIYIRYTYNIFFTRSLHTPYRMPGVSLVRASTLYSHPSHYSSSLNNAQHVYNLLLVPAYTYTHCSSRIGPTSMHHHNVMQLAAFLLVVLALFAEAVPVSFHKIDNGELCSRLASFQGAAGWSKLPSRTLVQMIMRDVEWKPSSVPWTGEQPYRVTYIAMGRLPVQTEVRQMMKMWGQSWRMSCPMRAVEMMTNQTEKKMVRQYG